MILIFMVDGARAVSSFCMRSAMPLNMVVKDLKTDHTEAEHAEETAQKDYERLMATSQESREKMGASITGKEASRAELQEKIENAKTDQFSTTDARGAPGEDREREDRPVL